MRIGSAGRYNGTYVAIINVAGWKASRQVVMWCSSGELYVVAFALGSAKESGGCISYSDDSGHGVFMGAGVYTEAFS